MGALGGYCGQLGMDAFSSIPSSEENWDERPKLTLSQALEKISLEQIPKPHHVKRCHDLAVLVVGILEREMCPGLAGHVFVAGSFGKGTAIANDSDYDIVIFFNDMEPPFTKLLMNMETALKMNAEKFNNFRWKFRSSIHICFDIDGIQFDLAPAAQLDYTAHVINRWCFFEPSLTSQYPSVQYVNTLKKMAELKDPERTSYMYSSSLAIDAVVFVQRQNAFIHSVIRLAKHWARNVNIGRIQVRGRSLTVETIAIHSCYSLSPVEMIDRNLDKAFLEFLKHMADVKHLRLYVFVNYQREDIPDSVYNQTPLVLDPANPYNNLLSPHSFPPPALKCFQEAAQLTMKKVKIWEQGNCDDIDEFRRFLQLQ